MVHGQEFGLYSNSKKLPNGGHSHGTPSVLCLEVVVLAAVGVEITHRAGQKARKPGQLSADLMGYSMVTLCPSFLVAFGGLF